MDRLESPLYILVFFVLALCFLGLGIKKRLTPHQLSLPPGPKGFPVLGNALEINRNEPWLTFEEWKVSYGEITSCKLLGQTYVVINSKNAAKALLEEMVRNCSLFGMSFITEKHSHQKTLDSSSIHKCHKSVATAAGILLENMLCSSESFDSHLRTYAASIVTSTPYGNHVISRDVSFKLEAVIDEMIQIDNLMTPGTTLPSFSRFLQNLALDPTSWHLGAKLQQLATQYKALFPGVPNTPFRPDGEHRLKDIGNDFIVAQPLVEIQAHELGKLDIKHGASASFIVGIHALQSGLSTLILALVLYPEIQDRAQMEIDRIVGRDRLPTLDDRESLQYLDALLRETLRWGALVPLAFPHTVVNDFVFRQRLIPKGSIMIQNLWSISREEQSFPCPTEFRPERHLNTDGNLLPDDVFGLYFGYAPGACPGKYLADVSMWLAAANILSQFRFSKTIGPAGYEVEVFPKFTSGVIRRPVPFSCCIKPRFEATKESVDRLASEMIENTS